LPPASLSIGDWAMTGDLSGVKSLVSWSVRLAVRERRVIEQCAGNLQGGV